MARDRLRQLEPDHGPNPWVLVLGLVVLLLLVIVLIGLLGNPWPPLHGND